MTKLDDKTLYIICMHAHTRDPLFSIIRITEQNASHMYKFRVCHNFIFGIRGPRAKSQQPPPAASVIFVHCRMLWVTLTRREMDGWSSFSRFHSQQHAQCHCVKYVQTFFFSTPALLERMIQFGNIFGAIALKREQ